MTEMQYRRRPLLHPHTAAKLRAKYKKAWGQEWPYDDRDLKELWDEAGEKSDRRQSLRHELVQYAMRECDTTVPEDYGRSMNQKNAVAHQAHGEAQCS